jgi:hypothetical protein
MAQLGSATPDAQKDAKEAIAMAEASSQGAFLHIREADSEGGDVSTLSRRFNDAMGLLDNASILLRQG